MSVTASADTAHNLEHRPPIHRRSGKTIIGPKDSTLGIGGDIPYPTANRKDDGIRLSAADKNEYLYTD